MGQIGIFVYDKKLGEQALFEATIVFFQDDRIKIDNRVTWWFNKILDDLENIEVKHDDEDKALLLLNALPKSFEHFKDALLYRRDQTITLEEVQNSIRT